MSVLHSQYHALWCTGDFRSQCSSRHDIDPKCRIFRLQYRKSFTCNIGTILVNWPSTLYSIHVRSVKRRSNNRDITWITIKKSKAGRCNVGNIVVLNLAMLRFCYEHNSQFIRRCWAVHSFETIELKKYICSLFFWPLALQCIRPISFIGCLFD